MNSGEAGGTDIGLYDAGSSKRRVDGAVAEITGKAESVVVSYDGKSTRYEAAVGLESEGQDTGGTGPDRGLHDPARTERGVEGAVIKILGQGEDHSKRIAHL